MTKHPTGWKIFIDLSLSMKDAKTLTGLYDLLLTAEEKDNLATRCLIVQSLLQQQLTQREIAQNLQVSIAKITRGSNELKRTPKKLLEYLRYKLKLIG